MTIQKTNLIKIADVLLSTHENSKILLTRSLIQKITDLEIEDLDEDIIEFLAVSFTSLSYTERDLVENSITNYIEVKIKEYELSSNIL